MIINICHRNNELLKNGKLDEQIIADLEDFIENRKIYQKEHLDKLVKGKSHHYEEWTEENQSKIKYAERILKCVKRNEIIEAQYTYEIDKYDYSKLFYTLKNGEEGVFHFHASNPVPPIDKIIGLTEEELKGMYLGMFHMALDNFVKIKK